MFLIALFIVIVTFFIGYPLLGAFGYMNAVNKSVMIGALCYILGILILVLLQKFTPHNLVVLLIVVELVVLIYRLFYVKKVLDEN
jgi:PST family polysaccharide transporter